MYRREIFKYIPKTYKHVRELHAANRLASITNEIAVDRFDPRLDKEESRKGYKFDEVANVRSLLYCYMATPSSDRTLHSSSIRGGRSPYPDEMEDTVRKMEERDQDDSETQRIMAFFKTREVTKPKPKPVIQTRTESMPNIGRHQHHLQQQNYQQQNYQQQQYHHQQQQQHQQNYPYHQQHHQQQQQQQQQARRPENLLQQLAKRQEKRVITADSAKPAHRVKSFAEHAQGRSFAEQTQGRSFADQAYGRSADQGYGRSADQGYGRSADQGYGRSAEQQAYGRSYA